VPVRQVFPRTLALLCSCLILSACSPSDSEPLPVLVNVFGHSRSKLPFIIAMDQGFYGKYGLDVELQMPPPEFEAGIRPQSKLWQRVLRRLGLQQQSDSDILVTGQTPSLYYQTFYANTPRQVALATTDCSVRYHVIARRFLQAALESMAIYHNQPELAVEIAQRWYGFPSRDFAQARYDRADYAPKLPCPCYEGIENAMRIHDSLAMRLNDPEDRYDDSLLRELIDSGFAAELALKSLCPR
jgi:ABC-type nitrate/sulfonate/bicarbonate transport system substrate-binding protein